MIGGPDESRTELQEEGIIRSIEQDAASGRLTRDSDTADSGSSGSNPRVEAEERAPPASEFPTEAARQREVDMIEQQLRQQREEQQRTAPRESQTAGSTSGRQVGVGSESLAAGSGFGAIAFPTPADPAQSQQSAQQGFDVDGQVSGFESGTVTGEGEETDIFSQQMENSGTIPATEPGTTTTTFEEQVSQTATGFESELASTTSIGDSVTETQNLLDVQQAKQVEDQELRQLQRNQSRMMRSPDRSQRRRTPRPDLFDPPDPQPENDDVVPPGLRGVQAVDTTLDPVEFDDV
jgi:hypothetical protein